VRNKGLGKKRAVKQSSGDTVSRRLSPRLMKTPAIDPSSLDARNRRIAFLEREVLKLEAENARMKVMIEEMGTDSAEKAIISAVKASGLIDKLRDALKFGEEFSAQISARLT
jgi:hypothetical protein